jgi:hypothetical protein
VSESKVGIGVGRDDSNLEFQNPKSKIQNPKSKIRN